MMKNLIYKRPTNDAGRFAAWLNKLNEFSGAYVIRNRFTKEVLYVGESHTGRMAKTIKRHFHTWNDSTDRQHFTDDASSVEIAVRVTPGKIAVETQNRLMKQLKPKYNTVGNGENLYEGFSPFDINDAMDPF